MAMLMHGAGAATLSAPKVRQYLSLSMIIPSRHHPEKFAEVCM